MTAVAYVDASALAKLVMEESGSAAMVQWFVEAECVLTSRLGVIETHRAVARQDAGLDPARVDRVLRSIEVFELDAGIARHAASVGPASLRTLDAIHLATALALGAELDAFVTYDDRLAEAARAVGLPVVRPA